MPAGKRAAAHEPRTSTVAPPSAATADGDESEGRTCLERAPPATESFYRDLDRYAAALPRRRRRRARRLIAHAYRIAAGGIRHPFTVLQGFTAEFMWYFGGDPEEWPARHDPSERFDELAPDFARSVLAGEHRIPRTVAELASAIRLFGRAESSRSRSGRKARLTKGDLIEGTRDMRRMLDSHQLGVSPKTLGDALRGGLIVGARRVGAGAKPRWVASASRLLVWAREHRGSTG